MSAVPREEEEEDRTEALASAKSDSKLVLSMPSRNAFFRGLESGLRRELPTSLQGFTVRSYFHLLKIAYGNERVHYEVGLDVQRRLMERALHFEDGPASTIAYLAYFDRHLVEIKSVLGWQIELERWTQSWGRIYEVVPLDGLGQSVTQEAVSRLSVIIEALQPLVLTAAIPQEGERVTTPRQDRRR